MTLIDNLQKIIAKTADNKLKQQCIVLNESISGKKSSVIKDEFKKILNESSDYEAKKMLNSIAFAELKDKVFRALSENNQEVGTTLLESYNKLHKLAQEDKSSKLFEEFSKFQKNYDEQMMALDLLRMINDKSHLLPTDLYESVVDSLESYVATSFTKSDLLEIADVIAEKITEAREISVKINESLIGAEATTKKINESFTKTPVIASVYSEKDGHLIIFDGKRYYELNEGEVSVMNQTQVLRLPNSWRMFTNILASNNVKINEDKITYNITNSLYPVAVDYHKNGEITINGMLLEGSNVRAALVSQSLNGGNDIDSMNAQEIANFRNSIHTLDFVTKITSKLNEELDMIIFNVNESKTLIRNSKSSSSVYKNVTSITLAEILKNFYGVQLNESVVTDLLNSKEITEELFESINLKNLDKNTLKVSKIIAPVKFIGSNPELLIDTFSYRILKDSVKVVESKDSNKLAEILKLDNVSLTENGVVYYINKNKYLNKVLINESGIWLNDQIVKYDNLAETLQEGSWSINEDVENIKIIFKQVDNLVEADNAWKISVNESTKYHWNVFKVGDSYFVDKIDAERKSRKMKVSTAHELLESIKTVFNVNIDESLNESLKISIPSISKIPSSEKLDIRKMLIEGKVGLVDSVRRFKKKKWFNTPEVYYLADAIENGKYEELAILESWLNVLKHFEFDKDVKNEIQHYTDIKDKFSKEFLILEALRNVKSGPQADFFSNWSNEIYEALNNDLSVEEIVKINNKWELHDSIKSLNAKLNKFRSEAKLTVSSLNESVSVENVVSPVCFNAEDPNITYFYSKPNFFTFNKTTNEIAQLKPEELEILPKDWIELCIAMGSEAVVIADEQIGMFLDGHKIMIDLKSNRVMADTQEIYSEPEVENNLESSTDSHADELGDEGELGEISDEKGEDMLSESLLNTGFFDYNNMHKISLLCKIFENRKNIVEIDFAKVFKNKLNEAVEVKLFKTKSNLYINGVDYKQRVNKFENTTATYATNLFKNLFGINISESLVSFLAKEGEMIKSVNENKSEILSKVMKYKDQLNKIQSAQDTDIMLKDSSELNEAKSLLAAEIAKLTSEVQSLDIKLNSLLENRVYKIGDKVKIKVSDKIGVISSIDESTGKFNILLDGKTNPMKFSEFDSVDSDIEIINQNVNENLESSIDQGFPSVGASAILVNDVEGINAGAEVLINPMEFTSSGDEDIISFNVNDQTYTTEKKNIKYVDPAAKKAIEENA